MTALQEFRRHPVPAGLSVLLLALGLGAALAVASAFEAILFRPLPFRDPDRLVRLSETNATTGVNVAGTSAATAADWINLTTSFAELAGWEPAPAGFALATNGGSEWIRAANVTWNLFGMLGIEPRLGRSFGADYEPGVLVSSRLWRRLGHETLDGATLPSPDRWPVIGVMPEGFVLPGGADVWLSSQVLRTRSDGSWRGSSSRSERTWSLVGRLRPGVTLEEARGEVERVAALVAGQHPETLRAWSATASSLNDALTRQVRPLLTAVALACVVLLVMTTANAMNLAVTRGTMRQRDFAVFAALGASPSRLFGGLLLERFTLGLLGTVGGVVCSTVILGFLRTSAAAVVPRIEDVGLRAGTTALIGMVALLLAVAEAVVLFRFARSGMSHLSLTNAGDALNDRQPWRAPALVTIQVATSTVLLVMAAAALLAVRDFRNTDRGYRPAHLAVAQLVLAPAAPPAGGAPTAGTPSDSNAGQPAEPARRSSRGDLHRALLEHARQAPRVIDAALVSLAPFAGETWSTMPVGQADDPVGTAAIDAAYSVISDDYFRVLGTRVIAGRAFDTRDDRSVDSAASAAVLGSRIVNRSLARQLFGRDDVVGERIGRQIASGRVTGIAEIVGVVEDSVLFPGAPARPEIYAPFRQNPGPVHLSLLVRTMPSHGPGPSLDVFRRIQEAFPNVSVFNRRTAMDVIDDAIPAERVSSLLLQVFATAALTVSLAGLAVMVHLVSRRSRRSLAIRVVLGARPRDLAALVSRRALLSLGAGVLLGIAGALVASRLLVAAGYWTSSPGAGLIVLVATLLSAWSLTAIALSAGPAMRTTPAEALRDR